MEIGNTDAEGRLVLADALALADEEKPELLVDMATLTGAARVALGPDLPPFYTDDDRLRPTSTTAADAEDDPLWRMPLWTPYDARLSSKIADINNVSGDGFAGSITAALFLQRFVERTTAWAHFDIFAWNPADRPHGPAGGEAQGIRALERVIARALRVIPGEQNACCACMETEPKQIAAYCMSCRLPCVRARRCGSGSGVTLSEVRDNAPDLTHAPDGHPAHHLSRSAAAHGARPGARGSR